MTRTSQSKTLALPPSWSNVLAFGKACHESQAKAMQGLTEAQPTPPAPGDAPYWEAEGSELPCVAKGISPSRGKARKGFTVKTKSVLSAHTGRTLNCFPYATPQRKQQVRNPFALHPHLPVSTQSPRGTVLICQGFDCSSENHARRAATYSPKISGNRARQQTCTTWQSSKCFITHGAEKGSFPSAFFLLLASLTW